MIRGWYQRVKRYREWESAVLKSASERITTDQELLREAVKTIDMWQQIALASQRGTRDLAIAFRAALDRPDVDLRDDVDELVRDLSDQVAAMEEQIIT